MVSPVSARVATAGEALIDLLQDADGRLSPCLGGAVYNLTRALARQGVPTLYLNPLSVDHFGQQLSHQLDIDHVRMARSTPVSEPTSLAVVTLDAQGKAGYSFYREGVADRQVNSDGMNAYCAEHEELSIVATGCLALAPGDSEKYLPWLKAQRLAGRVVAVDANLRPAIVPDMQSYLANVWAALDQAHIIKVSDDDLQVLGFGEYEPLSAARALLGRTSAHWLALTLGAEGAALISRDGSTWLGRDTRAVKVVDTVGAGDCFFAGLLGAWLSRDHLSTQPTSMELAEKDVKGLLGRAIASASLCVQAPGCTPPDFASVAQRAVGVRVNMY